MKDSMIIFRTKNVSMCSLTYVFKSLELTEHTEVSSVICGMPGLWKIILSIDRRHWVLVQSQSCLTLCNPMDCSTPGFPVHHQLLELAQTHVHLVGGAIQPSHPLSSPTPPGFNLSQHLGIFQWVSSLHQVAKVLEFQLLHQSFQWIFGSDFLSDWQVGSPCSPRDSQESPPTPQFKSINSSMLSFLYGPTLTSIHDYWEYHSFD